MRRKLVGSLLAGAALLLACGDDGQDVYAGGEVVVADCAGYTTCGACTPVLGCGWCYSTHGGGTCAPSASAPGDWTWDPTGCPVVAHPTVVLDGSAADVGASEAGADTGH